MRQANRSASRAQNSARPRNIPIKQVNLSAPRAHNSVQPRNIPTKPVEAPSSWVQTQQSRRYTPINEMPCPPVTQNPARPSHSSRSKPTIRSTRITYVATALRTADGSTHQTAAPARPPVPSCTALRTADTHAHSTAGTCIPHETEPPRHATHTAHAPPAYAHTAERLSYVPFASIHSRFEPGSAPCVH